jgi:sirohydrochlorin cobaltochelatase
MTRALILYAHGSRDPDWAKPLEIVRERTQHYATDTRVELAFLELQPPTLDDVVARLVRDGVRDIRVAPMFLGQGGHLKRDVTARLEAVTNQYTAVDFALLPSIGESPDLLEGIARSLALATGSDQ